MILSLIVYSSLAFFLWLLAKEQLNQSGTMSVRGGAVFLTWPNVLSILLFALIYGIRYNVGVDNLMYISIYEAVEKGLTLRKDMEYGYDAIQNLFIGIGFHYSVFIGLWGALQIGLIYYAMRRNKYLLPYIALFIVLGPVWLNWANIMRQAVAECAFIVLIEFIVEKKLWKYVVGVLLCTLVHKSAIMLLPFYFILRWPLFPKNSWVGVGIVLSCTAIGMSPTWIHGITQLESVLSFLDYDVYVTNLDGIMSDSDNFRAWGPSRAGLWLLYILGIWVYLRLRKRNKFDKRFDIYFECFFYGDCLYEIFANTNQIFIRPLSYFLATSVVMIPICLYYLRRTKWQTLYYMMCVLAFFNTFWWTVKAYIGGNGDEAFEVYKFFFMY